AAIRPTRAARTPAPPAGPAVLAPVRAAARGPQGAERVVRAAARAAERINAADERRLLFIRATPWWDGDHLWPAVASHCANAPGHSRHRPGAFVRKLAGRSREAPV